MILFTFYADASLACIAVKWLFAATKSTNPTLIAMIYLLLFLIVIKQVADCAEVGGHFYFTIFAILLRFLNMVTIETFYLLNFMSFHHMTLFRIPLIMIFYIVMTQSTCKKFIALRTKLLTPPFIMFTAVWIPFCFFDELAGLHCQW